MEKKVLKADGEEIRKKKLMEKEQTREWMDV